jgi:hypothetical protein
MGIRGIERILRKMSGAAAAKKQAEPEITTSFDGRTEVDPKRLLETEKVQRFIKKVQSKKLKANPNAPSSLNK